MHHLLESYRINTTWLIRTNSFIILSSLLISWRYLVMCGEFCPQISLLQLLFRKHLKCFEMDKCTYSGRSCLKPKCMDNAIHLHWINLYPVDYAIGFPYDPYICYDTSLSARKRYQPWFDQKPGQHSVFSFHNLILQLSYTYLRCLWKLERGYLKLKLSWFPKFPSKTVAKLHLFLLCLGKHYIDAQRSRSIFPLSYNEFSNKSAVFFFVWWC